MALLLQHLHQQPQYGRDCCAAAEQGGRRSGPEQAGAGAAQQGDLTRTPKLAQRGLLGRGC